MLHIYTASIQPATSYVDDCGGVIFRGGFLPEKKIYARCCGKKRSAKNCVVQCFYDGMNIWCAEGSGCKHPQAIARKRRQAHMNRSRAQQARRVRETSKGE